MRRRTKRDIGILIGVLAVIGAIAFVNSQLQRGSLARQMEQLRATLEEERAASSPKNCWRSTGNW